jgi:hypothetical protein
MGDTPHLTTACSGLAPQRCLHAQLDWRSPLMPGVRWLPKGELVVISRRRLLILLGLSSISAKRAACEGIPDSKFSAKGELPPHCEALRLVWDTQADILQSLELQHAKAEQSKQKEYVTPESRWWFDTDGRSWEVARPFGPGTIDSTHLFTVHYLVKDKALASWSVDTRKKQVAVIR